MSFKAVPFNKEYEVQADSYIAEKRTLGEFAIHTTDVDGNLVADIALPNGTLISVRGARFSPTYGGKPKREVFDEFVDTVLNNYKTIPLGVQEFRYHAPYGEVTSACELFSTRAFEKATGQRDSGWVEEMVPSYEFQILRGSVGRHTYLEQTCLRQSAQRVDDPYLPGGKELKVRTYETSSMAQAHDDLCAQFPDTQVLDTGAVIGDGRSCISVHDGTPRIYFRSGRTGFELYGKQGDDPVAFRAQIVPAAQQIIQDMRP